MPAIYISTVKAKRSTLRIDGKRANQATFCPTILPFRPRQFYVCFRETDWGALMTETGRKAAIS
ncbi:hypothetical protein GCM10010990_36870 [Croceicoccus mobilis]|uniref:Uncharacterized protein n=1 Tax=Croceicoccus mobilis TaxID=1703339 RepID=A0A916ZAA1_9SPHN|nr:hypothetical protein GCM10010990_36870 [Croceicoccus mobilis]